MHDPTVHIEATGMPTAVRREFGVGLFVYARPRHTAAVLEALRANRPSHLYIFSDGPRDGDSAPMVSKVREIVRSIDWCEVHLVEHETNLGLSASIVHGVARVFQEFDRGVFLEDDCIPSPRFLRYFSECFDKYEDHPNVLNISAYCPFHRAYGRRDADVFFSQRTLSWGWGTWKRAWKDAVFEKDDVRSLLDHKPLLDKISLGGRELLPRLQGRDGGILWDLCWTISVLLRDGLCVTPNRSLVRSIGLDGSGDNCVVTSLPAPLMDDRGESDPFLLPDHPEIDLRLNEILLRYCRGQADSTWMAHKIRRAIFHSRRLWSNSLPGMLKKV